jgi:hypothetical protein
MPKYKFWYDFGEKRPISVGTLTLNDDQAAIATLVAMDVEGVPTELWRQGRKPRLLATKAENGSVTRAEDA